MGRFLARLLPFAFSIGVWFSGTIVFGSPISEPLSTSFTEQHGLTSAWFTQLQIDPARGQFKDMILDRGTLFTVSDQSMVSAIDASTGQTRWSVQVGARARPTLRPGPSRRFVAVINGSDLFVLNRANGRLLWKTQLETVPGAGPAVSHWRVYVPLINGRVVCYRMQPTEESEKAMAASGAVAASQGSTEIPGLELLRLKPNIQPPLFIASPGKAIVPPVVVQGFEEEEVFWSTDQGYLCCGRMDLKDERTFQLRYRLKTDGPVTTQPACIPPDANVLPDSGLVVAASRDGYLYGINARAGVQLWRFSTGDPIVESPTILGHYAFVANSLGGLHCVDAKSGEQVWWTPGVTRFLAASKDRIYATDRYGTLLVLSAKTGARLDAIDMHTLPLKLTNSQTDRLFVASNTGMLQCLHEPALVQPLVRSISAGETDLPKVASKESVDDKPSDVKPHTPRPSTPSTTPSTPKPPSTPKLSEPKATKAPLKKRADAGTGTGTRRSSGSSRRSKAGVAPGMMQGSFPGAGGGANGGNGGAKGGNGGAAGPDAGNQ